MLNHAQSEPSAKTRSANTVHSNVPPVSVLPTLVLPAQMDNTCSKENVSLNVQFHWSTESVQISAQVDTSLKSEAETVLSAATNVPLAMVLLTDVLPVPQELPATEPVSHHAPPEPSTSTETAKPAQKDAAPAQEPSTNVPHVNQATSWPQENVSPHVIPTTTETETTVAENAPTLARPALLPLHVPLVLNQEINQSTVSATHASIHAPPVPITKSVPDVWTSSVWSVEDVPVNAQLDHQTSTESANAQSESSKTDNVSHHAQVDSPASMESAPSAHHHAQNAQVMLIPVPPAQVDSN